MAQPYIGEIRMFAGNFAPAGWMLCQGQLLPISEYDALFTLIGTTYGGDGQTTFALPDLRSRIPIHMGSGYVIGQTGGSETVALTIQQLPAHNHIPQADSDAAALTAPNGHLWAASNNYWPYAPATGAVTTMNPQAIAASGGSQAHDNHMPYLALNFIISLFGIFPTQA